MDIASENGNTVVRVDNNSLNIFHSTRSTYPEFVSCRFSSFLDKMDSQGRRLINSPDWVRYAFRYNALRYITNVATAYGMQLLVLGQMVQGLFDLENH